MLRIGMNENIKCEIEPMYSQPVINLSKKCHRQVIINGLCTGLENKIYHYIYIYIKIKK